MVATSSSEQTPSAAEVLRARYAGRLPADLESLCGPQHGPVDLPLHVVWSGLRTFDLDRPRSRMSLYRAVLAEGQHDDLVRFLDVSLLMAQWPVLRTLISKPLRDVWEDSFPSLRETTTAAA
ncbi:hypothetical protein [Streptomyces uncialis]|uniref:Uncharacterized protein n=1 Tax=Streptomyces uncialis TaxID=1048205 RepID=A0A1Q4UZE0_9ACTN|nr:hypothetical protein [Streptomyces uncialis]OKH90930.1 hypothetical protein AB852_30925 [Streptomyces uncialis]WTE10754.1 hypothetical protein OG924_10935 [Streptomyces uncialis]